MDRRKIIITVSIVTVIALLGGGYWYLTKKNILPTPLEMFPGEAGSRPTQPGEPVTPEEEEPTTPAEAILLPRLYELHKLPVAGAGFFEEGSVPYHTVAARYVERGLGYIFETPLASHVTESRIVNETRSRISEALWGNSGKSVVVRFVDEEKESSGTIKTRILNLGAPTVSFARSVSEGTAPANFLETEEVFLPDHIPFMATSEDGANQLFYLENGIDASVGSMSTFKYSDVSKIFNSSFTEWLPQFPNKTLVTLTTKPSATVPGHLFFINQKTGSITKVFGGINGLTTLTSHDGNLVLFSETKGKSPEISLYNTASKNISPLNIKTLPEKCAWGNKNLSLLYCAVPQTIVTAEYPDQWYQGVVSFSDDLWEINTSTLTATKIMSPYDFGASSLDIINPVLSQNDDYLLFMNKVSGTPWVYRINEDLPQEPALPEVTATPGAGATTTEMVRDLPSTIISDMQQIK